MIPFDFEYYKPETAAETIDLFNKLIASDKRPVYYGGGTEFISMARKYNVYADAVIDLKGISIAHFAKSTRPYRGFQCGYCTSGFLMACHALSQIHPDANDQVIEEWLQSNLCRCTGYEEIETAIKSVLKSGK